MRAAHDVGGIGHRVERCPLLVINGHSQSRLAEVECTVVLVAGEPDEFGLDAVDVLAAEQRRSELEHKPLASDIEHDVATGDVCCAQGQPGIVVLPALEVGRCELGQFLGMDEEAAHSRGDQEGDYSFHIGVVVLASEVQK